MTGTAAACATGASSFLCAALRLDFTAQLSFHRTLHVATFCVLLYAARASVPGSLSVQQLQ